MTKTLPEVLNFYALNKQIPEGAAYIGRGRGSIWGNPFEIGKDGTREEVIAKYAVYAYINHELMAKAREQLRGLNLVCFCAPKACHGDILLLIANNP